MVDKRRMNEIVFMSDILLFGYCWKKGKEKNIVKSLLLRVNICEIWINQV